MARYREIADDLRRRIKEGEFPVGAKLPGITALQEDYVVPGLNTVRAAQQLLVEEGMLEIKHGVGAFVVSQASLREVDLADSLAAVRDTLRATAGTVDTAIAALGRRGQVIIDLYANEDTTFVLTDALREWGARQAAEAEEEVAQGNSTGSTRQGWADEAERLLALIEAVS